MEKIPKTGKTLVLDLDDCLIKTFGSYREQDYYKMALEFDPLDRSRFYRFDIYDSYQPQGIGLTETYFGIKRPNLDLFLTFAFQYFKYVVVWSAAQKNYVDQLVKNLFRDHPRPYKVLTYNDVTHVDLATNNYHKPIRTILKADLNILAEDIVFVDDKSDNFRDNPHNGIVIPRFHPKFELAHLREDIKLLQIMQWLLLPEVIAEKDFRLTNKSKIFLTPLRDREKYQLISESGYAFRPMF